MAETESLRALLDHAGRLTPQRTMSLVAQVATVLHTKHTNGTVHAQLRPDQVRLCPDGSVELAEPCSAVEAITAPYLAPEQVDDGGISPATDVYALGLIAFECLTGEPPFQGATPAETAQRRTRDVPPALPDEVPAAARTVVTAALAKQPAARWSSAAAMADAAERVLRAPAGALVSGPVGPRPAAPAGVSHRALYLASAAAALVVLLITVFVLPRIAGSDPASTVPPGRGILGEGPAADAGPPASTTYYRVTAQELTPPLREGSCVFRIWFGDIGSSPVGQLRLYSGQCSGAAVQVASADPSGTVTFEQLGAPDVRTSRDACGHYVQVEATGHEPADGVGLLVRFPATGHTLVFLDDHGTPPVPVGSC
jgi:serine/threonine-protein kinase